MGTMMALLSGFTIVLNREINAGLGIRLGLRQSTLWNYITGLAVSLIVMLVVREPFLPLPGNPLLYTGGLMGVVVVMLSSYAAPKLSVFLMTLLVFLSQFGTGLVIDALQGMNLSPLKAAGGALVLAGLVVYVLGEKRRSGEM